MMTTRYLARLLPLGLAFALLPAPVAMASIFDGLLAGPVYKSFDGKFIDSKTVAAARAAPSGAVTAGNSALVGASVWDMVPSPELSAYAGRIQQRILAAWGGPHPQMRIRITSNPGLEAYSTGSGDIFLSRGWIETATREDELAAVIAHETSHILLNHFAREQANEGRRRAIAGAASAGVTALTLSSLRPQTSNQGVALNVADQKKLNDNVNRTLLIEFAIDEVSTFAFNSAWAREQEDEADLLAIDLLRKANYNVEGLTDELDMQKQYEQTTQTEVDTLSDQYADAMKAAAATGNLDTMKQTAISGITAAILMKATKLRRDLMEDHPSTQSRIDDAKKYIQREYEEDEGPTKLPPPMTAFKPGAPARVILANHNLSKDAQKKLIANDVGGAKPLAERGVSGATAASPYPLRVMATLHQMQNERANEIKVLQRAAASPDAAFATLTMLAGAYEEAGNFPEARAMLSLAATRFGSIEATYPQLIMLSLKQGRQDEATTTYNACLKVHNDDLTDQCKAAMGKTCTANDFVCAFGDSVGGIDNIGDAVKTFFNH